jgi:electron transport complex protein RnfG
MKDIIRYGLVLGFICLVASGLLAGANALTKDKIARAALAEEEESLREALPSGEYFEAVNSNGEILYYNVFDKDKRLVGVAFKAVGKGYSSDISAMVGMRKDGTITRIKILSQNETPGLGARVSEPEFSGQFSQKNLIQASQIQAITGATISSEAVINSVLEKARIIKKLID